MAEPVRRDDAAVQDIRAEHDDDGDLADFDSVGVQRTYLNAVQLRLKLEVANQSEPILLGMLRSSNWWLRAHNAPKICDMLKIECLEPSYFRDVHVWIPDLRWGSEAMPYCPSCLTNANVGAHGFRENHAGRRVFNTDTHYFVISRRYICHSCKEAAAAVKAAVASAQSPLFAAAAAAAATVPPVAPAGGAAAGALVDSAAAVAAAVPHVAPAGGAAGGVVAGGAAAVAAAVPPVAPAGGATAVAAVVQPGALAGGAAATDEDTPGQYSFMGFDQHSIAYLPFGYGEYFPAFLTYRSGVDKGVIHLMRPLFDAGVRLLTVMSQNCKVHTADLNR